jgi:hypothetical protein
MQTQCYMVLGTITKSAEIQSAFAHIPAYDTGKQPTPEMLCAPSISQRLDNTYCSLQRSHCLLAGQETSRAGR